MKTKSTETRSITYEEIKPNHYLVYLDEHYLGVIKKVAKNKWKMNKIEGRTPEAVIKVFALDQGV